MLKLLFLFTALMSTVTSKCQQPVISSFSPTSGNMGSSVTIIGTNFSPTLTNNVVYFGPAKASVAAATSSSLTVTVPAGATFDYITVTVLPAGNTAYSQSQYIVTFPGGEDVFTPTSFETVYSNFLSSGSTLNDMKICDLDNDGKPDLAAINDPGGNSFEMAIFRNTSINNQFSFAAPTISSSGGFGGRSICAADIDGDGLQDLLVGSFRRISIFRNISTSGNITLATPFQFNNISGSCNSVVVNDIDRDGKPDIAYIDSGKVCIAKNNSIPGTISLSNPSVIEPAASSTAATEHIVISDFDGDQKPDLAVTYFYIDNFYTFKNLSTPGVISFQRPTMYYLGPNTSPEKLTEGDFNNDGKQDLTLLLNDRITLYKNSSTATDILFTPFSGYSNLFFNQSVKLADMNGNGTVDLITNHSFARTAIIANNSRPCMASLSNVVNYGGSDGNDIAIADLTGDGKPDIIARSSNNVIVLKNRVTQTSTVCSGTNTTINSSLLGSNFQWQQNTGSGYLNAVNGPNLSGTNSSSLQIINAPLSWSGYKFRCLVNTDSSNAFTLAVISTANPSITISVCPSAVCAGGLQSYSTFITNGGINPAYQWQDSITAAGWTNIPGATAASLSSYPATAGVKIRCILNSSFTCASTSSVTSNVILIAPAAPVTPAVSVNTASTTVCSGANVTFTATPTNGNSSLTIPFYQWQVNGVNTGRNSPVFTTNSLNNGAQVKVIMTSTANCPVPNTATSNTVTMTVNAVVPAINIGGATVLATGQGTTILATVTGGGTSPVFQWQDSTSLHNWQNITSAVSASIAYTPQQTGDRLRCSLTSNALCATPITVLSNALSFTINPITAVSPVPGNNYGIKYFPNPTNTVLYIDSLRLSDKWETAEIINMSGLRLRTINIVNRDRVSIDLKAVVPGQYLVALRRKNGYAYLKFIKMNE